MTKLEENKKRLLDIVKRKHIILLNELASELGVSYMTVRRHLKPLEKKNLLSLVNGVVVYNTDNSGDNEKSYLLTNAETLNREKKECIGLRAALEIENNDVIIIDTGSTCEFIARNIPEDFDLTIICYTINSLMEVYKRSDCNIIFGGGYLHPNSLMFESPEAIDLVKRNRAAKAFVAASGVSSDLGVTCENHYEQMMKRAVISTSQKRILVADSSKFGKVRSTYFADLTEFNMVITDKGLSSEYLELFERLQIPVLLC